MMKKILWLLVFSLVWIAKQATACNILEYKRPDPLTLQGYATNPNLRAQAQAAMTTGQMPFRHYYLISLSRLANAPEEEGNWALWMEENINTFKFCYVKTITTGTMGGWTIDSFEGVTNRGPYSLPAATFEAMFNQSPISFGGEFSRALVVCPSVFRPKRLAEWNELRCAQIPSGGQKLTAPQPGWFAGWNTNPLTTPNLQRAPLAPPRFNPLTGWVPDGGPRLYIPSNPEDIQTMAQIGVGSLVTMATLGSAAGVFSVVQVIKGGASLRPFVTIPQGQQLVFAAAAGVWVILKPQMSGAAPSGGLPQLFQRPPATGTPFGIPGSQFPLGGQPLRPLPGLGGQAPSQSPFGGQKPATPQLFRR